MDFEEPTKLFNCIFLFSCFSFSEIVSLKIETGKS